MFFSSAGQWGHAAFLRGYHSLPIPEADRARAVARWLDVTPATVRDWISGRRPPPRAACYAVWMESAAGREAVACQLFNESRAHAGHARSLADALRAQSAALDALRIELADAKRAAARPGAHLAANDGAFSDFPPPRPAPRPLDQRA